MFFVSPKLNMSACDRTERIAFAAAFSASTATGAKQIANANIESIRAARDKMERGFHQRR